jgi:hypothetical protein
LFDLCVIFVNPKLLVYITLISYLLNGDISCKDFLIVSFVLNAILISVFLQNLEIVLVQLPLYVNVFFINKCFVYTVIFNVYNLIYLFWPNLSYCYPGTCPEGLQKTAKNLSKEYDYTGESCCDMLVVCKGE